MPTTIYTYLHDDELNGSRIVTIDDCMCKLYNIKRDDSVFLKDFTEDLQKPALYVLLNRDERKAYIGETDDFIKRINQHLSKKTFWKEVMVFLGENENTISKTEVQYLEFLAYSKAIEGKIYDLSENTQSPKSPHMSVIQRAKADKFFNYVQLLSKFIGCDIFEKNLRIIRTSSNNPIAPKILPEEISLTREDLSGKINLSLNGEGKYNKRQIVLAIVKKFLQEFPNTSLAELKATFKREYLGKYALYEFIQEDVESAKNWRVLGEEHNHYFDKDVLTSGDGINFVVCVEWERNNLRKVLGLAQALGWTFEIIKE